MPDVTVEGAEAFLALSKRLKKTGQTELRKELNKALKAAVKPVTKATQAEARKRLPTRGGLAAAIAKTPQRTQVRTGASTAGVRLVVGGKGGAARTADEGFVRHPVFGRGPFVRQSVPPGWFTDPAKSAQNDVRDEVVDVLEDVARRATLGGI